ncbi:MAG: hypothetical protein FD544_000033 [Pelagibacterales bacterium]|nr:hypothetical protein [Pelagibacterales bacterium]
MKLSNSNKIFLSSIFFLLSFITLNAEEESIDIWKKKNQENENKEKIIESNDIKPDSPLKINKINPIDPNIIIDKADKKNILQPELYGVLDPDENNFTLAMWAKTDAGEIRSIISRINKLNLSSLSESLFIDTMLTYSYLPKNMSDKEFLDMKINWMIKNKKDDLLETFLNKNDNFHNKNKIIQYLVDKNIAGANLKNGCQKINFINKEIVDAYLEKFKIYCLIFNNKKNQAQLQYDILKEQGMSDNFFDNKINFLFGITDKTDNKIKDDNLLNFYLSSITIKDFKYEPNKKTKRIIWEYLSSANLIVLENIDDIEKIKNLEIAANKDTFEKTKIFEIYKRIPFNLNTLINAEDLYQTLDTLNARALIYQKFLLSDSIENKIKLLVTLKELFKRDNLLNVYVQFMSQSLQKLEQDEIPDSYKSVVEKNIISNIDVKLGRIKYDDKILHRSRTIRFYTESNTSIKKAQKDFENVYKKIRKNKKYFFSAKDLALVESLELDGFAIPKEINIEELSNKYSKPDNLLKLVTNQEIGLLALKFVEIIGEDDVSDLDPETIYFIVHILNKANLIKLRNKIIISSLPLRA